MIEQPKRTQRVAAVGTMAADLAWAGPRTAAYATRAMVRPLRRARQHPEIAPRMPTPNFLASVFIDHVMMATLQAAFRTEDVRDLAEVRREVDGTIALLAERGWLTDPRGFHAKPPPPEHVVVEPARWNAFRYEQLFFESGYVSPEGSTGAASRWLAAPNRIAYAYLLRHPDGDHPWMVLQHGLGAGQVWDFFMMGAHHFHRDLGYNVIAPIAPYHGPRRVFHRSGTGMTSFDYVRNLHAFGQATWDIRRCISWVEGQGAGPVAHYGISLGGYLVSLVAGVDDRVGTAIAGIPTIDMAASLRSRTPAYRRVEVERAGLLEDCLEVIHQPISPLRFTPLTAQHRRFIYAGVGDQVTGPRDAYRLWQHWSRPNVLWFRGAHLGTMHGRRVKQFVDGALTSHAALSASPVATKAEPPRRG